MLYLVVLACLSPLVYSVEPPAKSHKLPAYLKVCHRSDPDLDGCIQNSVEQLRPMLAKGIAEMGVPSCDPLYVPELVMRQGHGSVAMQYTYTDVLIYGLSNFILHSVRVDLERDRLQANLTLPQLCMSGNYSVSGQILMLPIVGAGYSLGNYSNINVTVLVQWERVYRYGQVYLHVADFFLDFTIGHAAIHLTDLFDGNKELGDAMNLFINDNWESIAEDMKPALEEMFGGMLKKFANKIFHKFTLDELLPP